MSVLANRKSIYGYIEDHPNIFPLKNDITCYSDFLDVFGENVQPGEFFSVPMSDDIINDVTNEKQDRIRKSLCFFGLENLYKLLRSY